MSSLIDSNIFKNNQSNKKNSIKKIKNKMQQEHCEQCIKQNPQNSQLNYRLSTHVNRSNLNLFFQSILIKQKDYSLILYKNQINEDYYKIEGLILQSDLKFNITFNQKRILIGKQYIKTKYQNYIILRINMFTGEIKLIWPQLFHINQQMLQPKSFKNKINFLLQQFITLFQEKIVGLLRNINDCQYNLSNIYNFEKKQHLDNISNQCQFKQIFYMQKYLYMSTTTDNFFKQKQCYNKVQNKILKEKQDIIKVHKNIDTQFKYINSQVEFYSANSIKLQRNKLIYFGQITAEQRIHFSQLCQFQFGKNKLQVQQFILNFIGILKIENKKKFVSSCGTSNIYLMKIIFQYIFSDDPRYWIQYNKKTTNNVIQKLLIIKQSKIGFSNKIKHQTQIIKQMKAGFSIYLPRYYKVQNKQSFQISQQKQILLMDYLCGDKLDDFHEKNKITMSFWTKVFLIKHITNGIRFLSSYQITHFDLKPSNIIVVYGLLTKLIDFGESFHPKICKQKNYKPRVSIPYGCPEAFSNQLNFKQKCDVFSLGVIMYEFFFNRQFFSLPVEKIIQILFICPQSQQDCNLIPGFHIILNLINKCIDPDPENRPTLNWIFIILDTLLTYFKNK